MLREIDPNHDIMVGPVGMWMPWDPEAYKTGRVEYMEEELNQLMSEKNKNEANGMCFSSMTPIISWRARRFKIPKIIKKIAIKNRAII